MAYGVVAALGLATEKHKGQKYGERNYIPHVEEVMDEVLRLDLRKLGLARHTVATVAVLHDILEDTDTTVAELEKFGAEAVEAVLTITKQKGESRKDYLERVKNNKIAKVVKMADAVCNLRNSLLDNNAVRIARYADTISFLAKEK